MVQIPAPKFIIFYNGIKNRPEREVLKLSDMFEMPTDDPQLELKALLLNINEGFNEDLKEACKTLGDYAEYTGRVRKYAKEMSIEDAVEQAITECIAEGILAEFLSRNRAEAKKVSIYEYDEEKHMRMEREASFEAGLKEGKVVGLQEGKAVGLQEGKAVGLQEGLDRVNKLILKLSEAGRTEDITKAAKDREYQEELFREFGL